MKLTRSLVNDQEINFSSLHSDRESGSEINNTMKSVISVQNSSDVLNNSCDLKNRSADVIKSFLKKTIAAQSYNKMFSKGDDFKKLGIALTDSLSRKSSFSSLQHLNKVSKNYLTKIKEKTQNLTSQETVLLSKVIDAKIHFRHQSNSHLVNPAGTLNIISLDKLQSDGIITAENTYTQDIKQLSNQDFVFFGVEFSGDKAQLPLNTRHSTVDFGANAYIVDEQFPHGYLTLTDQMVNTIPPVYLCEHQEFIDQFTEVRNEIDRDVHGDKGIRDIPIFNSKDMKLGLGLHLIDFLRNSNDTEFKKFALDKNLDDKNLDKILNFVFQPEFHVPRMVSTDNFKEVKLRDISVREAVRASNFEALSVHIRNKDEACKVMKLAIDYAKKDVVDLLFSKFSFTKKDAEKISAPYFGDIGYVLSNYSADEKILKEFLERGLVEPNKAFKRINAGNTMLDNAIKYNKKEMINLLLEYGAVVGKEINNRT